VKKRAGALALCLLLALSLAAPPVQAAGSVYFTAAGNEILPLEDRTMPFWSGGYLYVASSIFTGPVNKSLGVAFLPSNVSNPTMCILYGGGRSLMFDLNRNLVQDTDGNTSFLGAIRQNGEIFVPASVVADFFKLEYSVTPMSVTTSTEDNYSALVWLRRPNFGLSENDFINAASTQIAMRYEQYLQDQSQESPAGTENPPAGIQPPASTEGKNIYLCFEAGNGTAALLDALDAHGAQATFFCSLEFLEHQGDLLRRMAATGHAIGLLADARDPERTVAEQLEDGNRRLVKATMGKTRLVSIQNGNEQSLQEVRELGFSGLTADLDWSGSALQNAAQGEALLRQASAKQQNVRVWLASSASAAGLRSLLSAAGLPAAHYLSLTETLS